MTDEQWMLRALDLARQAQARSEVPVGAVVVSATGELLGEGFNQPICAADPTAHAEIVALRAAAAAADPVDRIVVFGSFYTVGGVLKDGLPRLSAPHVLPPVSSDQAAAGTTDPH